MVTSVQKLIDTSSECGNCIAGLHWGKAAASLHVEAGRPHGAQRTTQEENSRREAEDRVLPQEAEDRVPL